MLHHATDAARIIGAVHAVQDHFRHGELATQRFAPRLEIDGRGKALRLGVAPGACRDRVVNPGVVAVDIRDQQPAPADLRLDDRVDGRPGVVLDVVEVESCKEKAN